jgi:hypothetical protein
MRAAGCHGAPGGFVGRHRQQLMRLQRRQRPLCSAARAKPAAQRLGAGPRRGTAAAAGAAAFEHGQQIPDVDLVAHLDLELLHHAGMRLDGISIDALSDSP